VSILETWMLPAFTGADVTYNGAAFSPTSALPLQLEGTSVGHRCSTRNSTNTSPECSVETSHFAETASQMVDIFTRMDGPTSSVIGRGCRSKVLQVIRAAGRMYLEMYDLVLMVSCRKFCIH
jgi:hypothetical protein